MGKLSKIIGSESQGRRPRHGISNEHRSSLPGRSELLPIRLGVGPNDPILVQIMRCSNAGLSRLRHLRRAVRAV